MYKIIYNDNTEFIGGIPERSKWNEQPIKLIKQIEYELFGIKYIFKNYESYNHLLWKNYFPDTQKELSSSIWLIGTGKNNYTVLVYSLIRKTATIKILPLNHQISKSSGWKEGEVDGTEFFSRILQD
jgi:hypothetical protein